MNACGEHGVYSLIKTMGMAAGMSKEDGDSPDSQTDWGAAWKALLWSFAAASVYTLLASWIPAIHSFPVASWLGMRVVTDWGWEVTPSMGYIGQGMIMGPKTAFSMLAGAVVGTLLDQFSHQTPSGKSNCHVLSELCLLLDTASCSKTQNNPVYIRPLLARAVLSVHAHAGCAAHSNDNWYSTLWLVCVLSAAACSPASLLIWYFMLCCSACRRLLTFTTQQLQSTSMQHCNK